MAVGFAAFSSELTINGTSEVTSSWNIEIINIRAVNDSSVANNGAYDMKINEEDSEVGPRVNDDKLSADFHTGLVSPNDARIYEVAVQNKGTLNATITKTLTGSTNPAIITRYDGVSTDAANINTSILTNGGVYTKNLLNTNETFDLDAGKIKYLYIYVQYNPATKTQPENLDASVRLVLDAVQKNSNSAGGASSITPSDLTTNYTETDGLYKEGNRYIFKGSSPKNWIKFNNENWRIMSIESNGTMKIIRDEKLSTNMVYDASDSHRKSGYCRFANYCNAWSSTYTPSGDFTNGSLSGPVTGDSTLKTYLNGDYLETITTNSDKIVTGTFNIGASGTYNDSNNIQQLQDLEDNYQWTGTVGLATKSEYMNANTNSSCLTASALSSNNSTCKNTNYLYKSDYQWWLLSPFASDTGGVLKALDNGSVDGNYALYESSVRPVLYLSSSLELTGTGEDADHAFEIQ